MTRETGNNIFCYTIVCLNVTFIQRQISEGWQQLPGVKYFILFQNNPGLFQTNIVDNAGILKYI
jgi:hypothetical protein